jgi:chromosome segregation ATPase
MMTDYVEVKAYIEVKTELEKTKSAYNLLMGEWNQQCNDNIAVRKQLSEACIKVMRIEAEESRRFKDLQEAYRGLDTAYSITMQDLARAKSYTAQAQAEVKNLSDALEKSRDSFNSLVQDNNLLESRWWELNKEKEKLITEQLENVEEIEKLKVANKALLVERRNRGERIKELEGDKMILNNLVRILNQKIKESK